MQRLRPVRIEQPFLILGNVTDLDFSSPHPDLNAVLVFADGTVFYGKGIGKEGEAVGEVCFNTSMTGYQEILTDPSYAGQIITFTFPHIGNVGINEQDIESAKIHAKGLIIREPITAPSNYRHTDSLASYLKKHHITGIYGVDTRAITAKIRKDGAQNAVIHYHSAQDFDLEALKERACSLPSLKGMELAQKVTRTQHEQWQQSVWSVEQQGYEERRDQHAIGRVVAIDYGIKYNIARLLKAGGLDVVIVPATATVEEILTHQPDGIFLSNGPGDPLATGEYALPVIKRLLEMDMPIFGICLGHQLLALSLGASTEKMHQGHRGANHPVQCLQDQTVAITSQNHGFVVSKDGFPSELEITHISLFDQTIQGIALKGRPVFSVQGHPEASPGPHDSAVLFKQFTKEIINAVKKRQQISAAG